MKLTINHLAKKTSVICITFISLGSFTAHSFPGRETQVPNNQWNCALCHVNPGGGGARTVFGEDTKTFGTEAGNVKWSNLCDRDSDSDSFTNGEELGDPNCMWTIGDSNPDAMVTNPNDPQSFPEEMMPAAGEEMMPVAGEEMMPVAGEEMMPAAGEEMMPAAGEEMMPAAGEEMMPAAGEEMVSAAGEETEEDDSGGCQSSSSRSSGALLMLLMIWGMIYQRKQRA